VVGTQENEEAGRLCYLLTQIIEPLQTAQKGWFAKAATMKETNEMIGRLRGRVAA
jgi:predicted RNA-binding protein YlxR (DUF448 family)